MLNLDLSAGAKIIGFADDIVYLRGYNSPTAVQEIQTDLNLIANHITFTKLLSINNNKSNFQILKRNHLGSVDEPDLAIGGHDIPVVSNVKYLGVTIDDHLNYSVHAHNQCAKLKKQCGYIYRTLRRCVSRKSLVYFYGALIRVSLLYAIEVSYPTNKQDCKSIERVQRFACQLITGNYDTAYNTMLSDLNLQSIWQTVFTRRLTLMHSYISGYRYSPPGMINLIRDSTNRYSTRSNHHNAVAIPNFKLNTLAKSPLVSSSVAYNLLPSNLVSLNKKQFKKAVSNHSIISTILEKTSNLRSKIVFKLDL